ncbi:UrcA family protein [Sphingomonas sp. YR710]|jgi:UrcA family protein|uniref:UrcA family protein n=1 Tax=Sphingomonas sp. YR710 TaxID=1882773 RepID=UPI00088B98C0|nr:UrcA family protein [Sphingomonas sp. YR710]SDD53507.1 UrcA family protein [Sphingomonas sp. YR710]
MIRSILLAVASVGVSAAAMTSAPAFAAEAPRIDVHYDDLSLRGPQGAQELKVRVERAARRVCATNGVVDLQARAASAECRRVAVVRAMPQVELALANAQNQRVAENSRVSVAAH